MRLTPFAKGFIAIVILASTAAIIGLSPGLRGKLFPAAPQQASSVPDRVVRPDVPAPPPPAIAAAATGTLPPCAGKPEVTLFVSAWNAQTGLIFANGGAQANAQSITCQEGVNLRLVREDDVGKALARVAGFAEKHAKGEPAGEAGIGLIVMGDGAATHLYNANKLLGKVGGSLKVYGAVGFSRGEDSFLGKPEWKRNPQAARGSCVAGVPGDGDVNIVYIWAGDNGIPINPNLKAYDPSAINIISADDYLRAAEMYVTGYCTDLPDVRTGKVDRHCVDGVATWTPGDVNVATKKGGLVPLLSTYENRDQMPATVLAYAPYVEQHPEVMVAILSAAFRGADEVRDEGKRGGAAHLSAKLYNSENAAYWFKYFTRQHEVDAQGLQVTLGGSAVANYADNKYLFGGVFQTNYKTFGTLIAKFAPDILPKVPDLSAYLDLRYLDRAGAHLRESGHLGGQADLPKFGGGPIRNVVAQRSWDIQFATGRAEILPASRAAIAEIESALIASSGVSVEIHGHTDSNGTPDGNMKLSAERAASVRRAIEATGGPSSFPEGRIRTVAHGMLEPVASNLTAEGRARNRRVVVRLGTE